MMLMEILTRLLLIMACVQILWSCSGLEEPCSMIRTTTVPMTTRASVENDGPENRINTLEAMAFISGTGLLEDYGKSNDNDVVLEVRADGEYDCIMGANVPEGVLPLIWDKDRYRSTLSYFSDNSTGSFVMSGETCGYRLSEEGDVAVNLSRLASKITLGVVEPAFITPEIAATGVVFDRAFLINVTGECLLCRTPSAGSWRNCLSLEDSLSIFESEAYCRDFGIPVVNRTGIKTGTSFYCYPNPVDNGVDSNEHPEWSPRNTRLVLELTIDGVKNYYPITLPAMECNKEYVIERVRLLGYGNDIPDKLVTRTEIEYNATVLPWADNIISPVWY